MPPCHKGRSKLQKPTFQNIAEFKSLKHGTIESVQQGANYLTGKLHHKTAQFFHTIFKKKYTRQLGKTTPGFRTSKSQTPKNLWLHIHHAFKERTKNSDRQNQKFKANHEKEKKKQERKRWMQLTSRGANPTATAVQKSNSATRISRRRCGDLRKKSQNEQNVNKRTKKAERS